MARSRTALDEALRLSAAAAGAWPLSAEGRALALDLGERRIGVAICDDGQTVATPLGTVERVGDRTLEHAEIAELVETHRIVVVVVGLPLSAQRRRWAHGQEGADREPRLYANALASRLSPTMSG